VELTDFTPIAADISLADIRDRGSDIYGLRDRLLARYGRPLYLGVSGASGVRAGRVVWRAVPSLSAPARSPKMIEPVA